MNKIEKMVRREKKTMKVDIIHKEGRNFYLKR